MRRLALLLIAVLALPGCMVVRYKCPKPAVIEDDPIVTFERPVEMTV